MTNPDHDDQNPGEWYDDAVLTAAVILGFLDLFFVAFFYAAAFAILWHFGGGMQPGRRHCPACQRDGLLPLEADHVGPGRLTIYRCALCGAAYRRQLDGTLAAMAES